MSTRDVERRMTVVLKKVAGWLPDKELAELQSIVEAGEPGIALENLCTQLEECDVTVPHDIAIEVKNIANSMGVMAPRWIERQGHA